MLLYTYWARRAHHYQAPDGRTYRLVAYAGSNDSPAAAEAAAAEKLQQRQLRLERRQPLGAYPGGQAPLREPVEQRLTATDGQLLGAVTRNRYGSRVLNAPRVMFLDIDRGDLARRLPQPSFGHILRRWLGGLFGAAAPPTPPLTPEAYLVGQLQLWLQQHPDWNFRLYRTRAGFRVLVTHAPLEPNGSLAAAISRFLPVDETYVRLCQRQACYRARLDPKPWRIGLPRPPHVFPYETPAQATEQAEWEAAFRARQQGYSVCQLVGSYGSGRVCADASAVQVLHDELSLGGRPLA